jgi:serine/threonine protein kinase
VQIADFGLTRAMAPTATHVSTASHGTVTHMPPEVLMEGQLRPAADVYSFGVMSECWPVLAW